MVNQHAHEFSTPTVCKTGNPVKTDLIRQIRIREGNYACFAASGSSGCGQSSCPWRRSCLNVAS